MKNNLRHVLYLSIIFIGMCFSTGRAWSAPWDQADIEDVTVAGNATKKYSNLNYAGIEFHSPGLVVASYYVRSL